MAAALGPPVMYKIDRKGGVQNSFTRTDPIIVCNNFLNCKNFNKCHIKHRFLFLKNDELILRTLMFNLISWVTKRRHSSSIPWQYKLSFCIRFLPTSPLISLIVPYICWPCPPWITRPCLPITAKFQNYWRPVRFKILGNLILNDNMVPAHRT